MTTNTIAMKFGLGLLMVGAILFLLAYGLGDRDPDRGDIFLLVGWACGCAGAISSGANAAIRKLQARIAELEAAR